MDSRHVSFEFDGDTFVGQFSLSAGPDDTIIVVRYKRAVMSANIGRLPEEVVAKTLLGELVRDDLALLASARSPAQRAARPVPQPAAPQSRLRRPLRVSDGRARSTGPDSGAWTAERLR